MLSTWSTSLELHLETRRFPAFLRDCSIRLSWGSVNQGYGTWYNIHSYNHPTTDRITLHRIHPHRNIQDGDSPDRKKSNRFLYLVRQEGGTQVGRAITHRREKFKEDHGKVTGKDHQEVYGSIPNNPVEKVLHNTLSTYVTLAFRRIYDSEEGRDALMKRDCLLWYACRMAVKNVPYATYITV